MSDPTIRLATPQDYDAVTTLVNTAYEKYIPRIGAKPMPMLSDYQELIARRVVHVLENEGAVIGVLVLESEPDHLFVDNIALLPKVQGMGYGKRLMGFAEASARAQGKNEIRLLTNEKMYENIAIYKQLGFVETERRTENGFTRVYMRKVLV